MKIPRMFRQKLLRRLPQTRPVPLVYVPEPSTTLPNVKATPSDIKAPSPMVIFKTSDGKIIEVEDFYLKANR
jgi:hypothetical protein